MSQNLNSFVSQKIKLKTLSKSQEIYIDTIYIEIGSVVSKIILKKNWFTALLLYIGT